MRSRPVRRAIVVGAALVASAATLAAQATPAAQAAPAARVGAAAFDPAVTVGTLPNGMRYYIQAHHGPEHRVELRLVVDAGSVLETPSELGVAHFVEHMAF